MATYNRSARLADKPSNQRPNGTVAAGSFEDDPTAEESKEKMVRINGYQQVLEMLQAADPEFRRSLLQRITAKNPKLGAELRRSLQI